MKYISLFPNHSSVYFLLKKSESECVSVHMHVRRENKDRYIPIPPKRFVIFEEFLNLEKKGKKKAMFFKAE